MGVLEKHQVQEMVQRLLNLKELPKPDDAADALAAAICQAHRDARSLPSQRNLCRRNPYAYLRGKIIEKSPETGLILDVHGIGYQSDASRFSITLTRDRETYEVPVSYQVREDDATLYGFPSNEEKHLFELLISVTGIGPKMGIQMVDKLPPEQFALAILNGDIPRLTQVKGVGKKTAQRLILELKDKLKEESWVQDAEDIEIETPVEEPDEAR